MVKLGMTISPDKMPNEILFCAIGIKDPFTFSDEFSSDLEESYMAILEEIKDKLKRFIYIAFLTASCIIISACGVPTKATLPFMTIAGTLMTPSFLAFEVSFWSCNINYGYINIVIL